MSTYHDQPGPPWAAHGNRRTSPPGSMRVSDAERTEVANALIRHYADGRLDDEEYAERMAKTTGAKTRADLAPLLVDLPRLDASTPATRSERRGLGGMGWVLFVVLALLSVGWTVTGLFTSFFHPHVPWFLIVVVVFVLVRRGRWHRHRHWY